mmetsp:Transcript_20246/g.51352  ORF Transcript_20246/g.51352 Transcript_20246/m.51352 type:complete len:352 (+) Transcript_20246:92-1147(+)
MSKAKMASPKPLQQRQAPGAAARNGNSQSGGKEAAAAGAATEIPRSRWPWRARARLVATMGNSAIMLYIYGVHLLGFEWEQFGRFRTLAEGQSKSVRDYLWAWELDPAFEHLRHFTFSEAMLENLNLYLVVGTPVAVVLVVLERDRIRWLQHMLTGALPDAEKARRAKRCLDLYFWTLSTMMMFILLIGPFHLGWPRAHYCCAFSAITCGCISICLYLAATVDLSTVVANGDEEVAAWASGVVQWVRPVLKFVLSLHVLALGSAVWKAESLGDDRSALLFGILETTLVLGYQLFAGIFVVDDVLVARRLKMAAAAAEAQAEPTVQNSVEAKLTEKANTPGRLGLSDRLMES